MVIASGGATAAQLYRMGELMNPGLIVDLTVIIDTYNVSRSSEWLVCLSASLPIYASVPIFCGMAEISVLGTDRLHNPHESRDTTSSCEET